jgi:hypothetical protein
MNLINTGVSLSFTYVVVLFHFMTLLGWYMAMVHGGGEL